jgi:peptidoglycan/xylan/chitin deacetylase (PgdA/CDA1 family)
MSMQSKLNNSQIDYIFYHLNLHFNFTTEIKKRIVFDDFSIEKYSQIVFPLSSKSLLEVKYIDNLPILFPVNSENVYYDFDENNNLLFNDDLLKSAFYLLSGYQETEKFTSDNYDRFSYGNSIQKKLNIAHFPLVNHYFEIIIDGIEEFCKRQNVSFEKHNRWDNQNFGFLLTHDVDRVDKYAFRYVKLKIKQFIGLYPSKLSKFNLLKLLVENIVKLFGNDNPYWNFDWMKSIEKKFGINSVWFFLPKGDSSIDAYYSFEEERIKQVVSNLVEEGDEIGLHATYHSYNDEKIFEKDFISVKKLFGENPIGNRQHWLRFKYPNTLRILEKTGIKYDSSWAFNDHIGWRNSYCLPFRPYDIENNRMMEIWEFPLTVMDGTLFQYMKMDQNSAMKDIDEILNAVTTFNGLFTLLWHNSFFELENGEELSEFYNNLLQKIASQNPKNILPQEYFV